MKYKQFAILCLVAFLLGACGKKNETWEYQVLRFGNELPLSSASSFYPNNFEDPSAELNRLGAEGWELVSTYTTVETKFPNFGNEEYVTGIRENTRTSQVSFVLKRRTDGNKSDDSNPGLTDDDVVVVEESTVEVADTIAY